MTTVIGPAMNLARRKNHKDTKKKKKKAAWGFQTACVATILLDFNFGEERVGKMSFRSSVYNSSQALSGTKQPGNKAELEQVKKGELAVPTGKM